MKRNIRWFLLLAMCLIPLLLTACSSGTIPVTSEGARPITIERLSNANAPTSERLTEEAARRIDIQTAAVVGEGMAGLTIPEAALLYDNDGNTWAYVNTAPLTYVRTRIQVDRIDGNTVHVTGGLTQGMKVVTTGAVELYGSEFEFEEE